MNITRRVRTEHSDYAFDYEAMMFTRIRREPFATELRRALEDGHPFTSASIVDGRLEVVDTHSGYWLRSSEVLSDTSETVE